MHTRTSPFPRILNDGRVCIDEMCRCGYFRSVHTDTSTWGTGPCVMANAKCNKFSFATYVFERSIAFTGAR